MTAVQRNQSQTDYCTGLARLVDALELASGADAQVDALIAEVFRLAPAEFTSSAEASRHLSAQLLPHWQLRVGYDVCGILPSATVSLGGKRHSVVAPSCAYFAAPGCSLEEAQLAKKQHLIGKLLLEDGQSVLDIGCGWGGMALEIARSADVDVQGITLSEEQLVIATQRGAATKASFSLTDYRDATGTFDRIISVGMFEHVGVPNYDAFFQKIASLLADDGVAVIHSIGRKDGPDITNAWIAKYIFPGGYIPALSEVLPAIERAGLWITDVEILRLHYAETLRHWFERFMEHREEIAALYDERFCRMWEFYLATSESAFRGQGHMNFQIQLAKRVDTVPLTRDYISDHDRKAIHLETDRSLANGRHLSLV